DFSRANLPNQVGQKRAAEGQQHEMEQPASPWTGSRWIGARRLCGSFTLLFLLRSSVETEQLRKPDRLRLRAHRGSIKRGVSVRSTHHRLLARNSEAKTILTESACFSKNVDSEFGQRRSVFPIAGALGDEMLHPFGGWFCERE